MILIFSVKKIFIILPSRNTGVLFLSNWKAEIIPLEPDPDNTGVGRGPKVVVFSLTPPM